jgi:UDP-glucose 4-epimerase
METALVLGAGQIGTFVARELADAGAAVVVADSRPARRFFARFGPSGTEVARIDVLDRAAVRRVVRAKRVDVVVFAAGLGASASATDPQAAWLVNVRGPELAADAAMAGGATRFVLVSSFAVYGRPLRGPVTETTPLAPSSAYGRCKVAGEEAVLSAAWRGLDVRVVRPCGVYGPNRPGFGSRSTRLVDTVLAAGLAGRGGTLTTVRADRDEYLYVKDLARALSLVSLRRATVRDVAFNVGTGSITGPGSLRRALETVLPSCGVAVVPAESLAEGPRFPLDVTRVRQVFGFAPRYDLARGLGDYLATMALA